MRVLLDTNILLRLLNPVDREYSIVRTAVDTLAVRGIVAVMLAHGVPQLLTLNDQDFARYPAIKAVHPNDITQVVSGG